MKRAWPVLAIVLLLAAVVRGRLLDVPLERDEGEYAYIAQLMLEGVPPYTLAYTMKLPGIHALYALILATLGASHGAIHLGLLLVNALTTLLVFQLARRWLSAAGALSAAAAFALLTLGKPVHGLFANAEHFVLPFAIGGLVVVTDPERATARSRLVGGLLLGVGILTKQHGALFALAALVLAYRVRRAGLGWLVLGVLAPYAATCLSLGALGAFDRFWFWTVEYAGSYSTRVSAALAGQAFAAAAGPILQASPLLWLLAAIGAGGIWLDPAARPRALSISLFAALSFAAVCPGLYFRKHYFLLLLPAAAILVGAGVEVLARLLSRGGRRWLGAWASAGLLVVAAGDALARQRDLLFEQSPLAVSRATFGWNPFPESLELARYIREHSSPEERIAVLGSEPQILFYAGRRSVTPYIYTYPLMELHEHAARMQREMIADIERERPRFVVYVNIPTSWLKREGSHLELFQWLQAYQKAHYRVVALAEILSDDETAYSWEERVAWPPRRTEYWMALLERR